MPRTIRLQNNNIYITELVLYWIFWSILETDRHIVVHSFRENEPTLDLTFKADLLSNNKFKTLFHYYHSHLIGRAYDDAMSTERSSKNLADYNIDFVIGVTFPNFHILVNLFIHLRQRVSSQCYFSFIYYRILLMSRFPFHCQQWLVRERRAQSGEEEKLWSILI